MVESLSLHSRLNLYSAVTRKLENMHYVPDFVLPVIDKHFTMV